MTTFKLYTTIGEMRWDQIAVVNRGQDFPYDYQDIILANLTYLTARTVPGGVTIRIPVVENLSPTITDDKLPPWRRSTV